jgi:hypothetical protein
MTGRSAFTLVRSGKENPVCAKPAKAEGWHAVRGILVPWLFLTAIEPPPQFGTTAGMDSYNGELSISESAADY